VGDGASSVYASSVEVAPDDVLFVRVFVANTGDAEIHGPRVTVQLDKQLEYLPGSSVQYTKDLSNTNIQVPIPDDYLRREGSRITWGFGVMPPVPQSAFYLVFHVRIVAEDKFEIGNTAFRLTAVVAWGDQVAKTNDVTVTVVRQAERAPWLVLRYDVTNGTLAPPARFEGQVAIAGPGDILSYRAIVLNRGRMPAGNVKVRMRLPENVTYRSARFYSRKSKTGRQIRGDELVRDGYLIPLLAGGNRQAVTFILEAEVSDPFPSINTINVSEAEARYQNHIASSIANVFIGDRGLVVMQRVSDSLAPFDYSQLGSVRPGQTLTWRVILQNNAKSVVHNPAVRLSLPRAIKYLPGSLMQDGEPLLWLNEVQMFNGMGILLADMAPGYCHEISLMVLVKGDSTEEGKSVVSTVTCWAEGVTPVENKLRLMYVAS
jgi:uncharacterized repeat protein (TIGR01451 family)